MSRPAPLINRPRAQDVLGRAGVAALVLSDPVNIYYATGFWPQTVAMGQAGAAFAVVPADAALPVTLISSQFIHYLFDLDTMPAGAPLEVRLFTAPEGLEGSDEIRAAPPIFLKPTTGGTPDPMDAISQNATRGALAIHPAYPDVVAALRDTLAAFPGTLGIDSFIAQGLFGDAFAWRPADPLLRAIRMVKTPAEIVLARHAARNNAQAARAAIESIRPGDTYQDLRSAFFAETGRRGGVPLFVSTDSMAMRMRDGVIRAGRSFQIDAVSHYGFYHGDYGRTVFVGEPDPVILRMVEAAVCANDAIAAQLRPGLRFSDVRAIGHDALKAAGFDQQIACVAHSVGLFHTDEAFRGGALHFAKDDHIIEANMVLSIDCPVLHLDAAGNVHLEDLWLVT
ncbi:MAG TPA: M24 family metallopeptidase, partial [Novosphingobium sp.]|nr:M24 family metallopeptidase [Novosphingobium sp.]